MGIWLVSIVKSAAMNIFYISFDKHGTFLWSMYLGTESLGY